MGCINFKDQPLIKKWQASKKMTAMNKKLKDEKTWGNVKSCFGLLPKSCEHF